MVPRKIEKEPEYQYKYSVCTLVTDFDEYNEMILSFTRNGFSDDNCEFIYADNTNGNQFDAYQAINRFLLESRGEYIILCHQDILLIDGLIVLEKLIKNITLTDASWAILSNAGASGLNFFSMFISYPDGEVVKKGVLPQKVKSVDENFIVVRAAANVAVSADLSGFHMYGTDLTLIANMLGYSAYTIPFNLVHKSRGNTATGFWPVKKSFIEKYNRKLNGRWIQTTITNFYISGSVFDRILCGNATVRVLIKSINSLKKKRRKN